MASRTPPLGRPQPGAPVGAGACHLHPHPRKTPGAAKTKTWVVGSLAAPGRAGTSGLRNWRGQRHSGVDVGTISPGAHSLSRAFPKSGPNVRLPRPAGSQSCAACPARAQRGLPPGPAQSSPASRCTCPVGFPRPPPAGPAPPWPANTLSLGRPPISAVPSEHPLCP